MGDFRSPCWVHLLAILVAATIVVLNILLLFYALGGKF